MTTWDWYNCFRKNSIKWYWYSTMHGNTPCLHRCWLFKNDTIYQINIPLLFGFMMHTSLLVKFSYRQQSPFGLSFQFHQLVYFYNTITLFPFSQPHNYFTAAIFTGHLHCVGFQGKKCEPGTPGPCLSGTCSWQEGGEKSQAVITQCGAFARRCTGG